MPVVLEKIDIQSLPNLSLEERSQLPNVPAIYFVLSQGDSILYIGRAKSLCLRWQTHHRIAAFKTLSSIRIAWLTVSSPALLPQIEKALIEHFHPPYNGHNRPHELRQTTFRIDPDLLRRARFYLDEEGKSVAQFVVEQLERYVREHEEGGSLHASDEECA
jgi:hypothetical protein